VNENQEVVQGDVIALSEDWEVFKQNWQPEDPTPDAPVVEEPTTNAPPVFVGVEVPFEGEIDSVYVNPEGDIVIINEEGEETVIDQPVNAETGEPENTRITDSSGQQWVVDKDGNVTKIDSTVTTSNSSGYAVVDDFIQDFYIFYLNFDDFKFNYCTALPEEKITDAHKEIIAKYSTNGGSLEFERKCELILETGKISIRKPLHIVKNQGTTGDLVNYSKYYDIQKKMWFEYRYKYELDGKEYIVDNQPIEVSTFSGDVELKLFVAKQEGDFMLASSVWIRKKPIVKGLYRIFHNGKQLLEDPLENSLDLGTKITFEVKQITDNGDIVSVEANQNKIIWEYQAEYNQNTYTIDAIEKGFKNLSVNVNGNIASVKIRGREPFKPGIHFDSNEFVEEAKVRIEKVNPEFISTLKSIQINILEVEDSHDAFLSSKAVAPSGNTFGVASLPITYRDMIRVDPNLIVKEEDGCIKEIPVLYQLTSIFSNGLIESVIKGEFKNDELKELFSRFKETYPEKAKQIEGWIISKELNEIDEIENDFRSGKFAYKLTDEELNSYVELSNIGTIHLNKDNLIDILKYSEAFPKAGSQKSRETLLNELLNSFSSSSTVKELIQKQYTRVLAHEGSHIYYALKNKIPAFKWAFVDNNKIKDCYPYQNGNDCTYCSMAHGHEKNNSDGKFACQEQCKHAKPVYYE
jgi:hypothetical protein